MNYFLSYTYSMVCAVDQIGISLAGLLKSAEVTRTSGPEVNKLRSQWKNKMISDNLMPNNGQKANKI